MLMNDSWFRLEKNEERIEVEVEVWNKDSEGSSISLEVNYCEWFYYEIPLLG